MTHDDECATLCPLPPDSCHVMHGCEGCEPHHPSSADLAAFRRSIIPRDDTSTLWRWELDHPTAHDWEREQGIGYRASVMGDGGREWTGHWSDVRTEASALRSRAYAAEAPFRILAGDPGWLDPMDFPELPE